MGIRICFVLIISLSLYSCGLQKEPIETIADVKEGFQQKIEDTTATMYPAGTYKSLAFGEMKVYRPPAFEQLDSIYSIKQHYLQTNDLRGLHKSGIEDLIPGYRAAAREQLDSIKYEIEHVYEVDTNNEIAVHHTFYVFNYKDSLTLIYPFYSYRIPKSLSESFYNYTYHRHFLTDRDLYISQKELNFISYFDKEKVNLIGTDELQSFMQHIFKLMQYAHSVHSVSFNELSKYVALHYLKDLYGDLTILNFGQLYSYSEGDKILSYEITVKWKTNASDTELTSVFSLDPYLQVKNVKTN